MLPQQPSYGFSYITIQQLCHIPSPCLAKNVVLTPKLCQLLILIISFVGCESNSYVQVSPCPSKEEIQNECLEVCHEVPYGVVNQLSPSPLHLESEHSTPSICSQGRLIITFFSNAYNSDSQPYQSLW